MNNMRSAVFWLWDLPLAHSAGWMLICLCLHAQAFMRNVVEREQQDPTAFATEARLGPLQFQIVEYVQFLYSFARSQSMVLPVHIYERCAMH